MMKDWKKAGKIAREALKFIPTIVNDNSKV